MAAAMLPKRGICLGCRAQGLSRTAPSTSRFYGHKQFSSAARSSASHGSLSHSVRPIRPTTSKHASPLVLRPSSQFQARYKSSLQPPVETFTPTPPPAGIEAYALEDPVARATQAALEGNWYIGYLKDAGLDFGWGPSSMIMWLFEHVHSWGGLTVGGSILLFAVFQRLVTFPLVIGAADQSARFRSISSQMTVLQESMKRAAAEQNQLGMMKTRKEMRDLMTRHDIKYWKMFLPMVQMPIGFGAWRTLRNAAFLPAPGMMHGGYLWFQNLSMPDPYFILPLLTAAFQHLTVRLGGEMGGNLTQGATLRKVMLYGLPALSLLITSYVPSAVQLTFVTAASLSTLSNLLLRNASFRQMCGIAPRVASVPTYEQIKRAEKEKTVYKGTINVENNNAKPHARPRADSARGASSPLGALKKLNPRTWFSKSKKQSGSKGGIMESTRERQEKQTEARAQERYEAKRKAAWENERAQWRQKDAAGRRR